MSDYQDWLEDQFYHERGDRLAALANGEVEPLTEKEKQWVREHGKPGVKYD